MSAENIEQQVEKSDGQVKIFPSPTLTEIAASLPQLLPPEPYPVCMTCPNSLWFAPDNTQLRCWCDPMKCISWDTQNQVAMPLCDGLFKTDDKEESGLTTGMDDGQEPEEPPMES